MTGRYCEKIGRIAAAAAVGVALFVALSPGDAEAQFAGRKFSDCDDCPTMIVIGPGTYTKGSPPGEAREEGTPERDIRNETPQTAATVERAFAISVHEITREDYGRFVDATGYESGGECITWDFEANQWGARGERWSWRDPGFPQGPSHPVVCVSFTDAQAYVDWLAETTGEPYRLLTDVEWEYVARDGSQDRRPWSDDRAEGRFKACDFANVLDLVTADALGIPTTGSDAHVFPCRDGYVYTAPVGDLPQNGYGVADMLGNAWEWVDGCMDTGAGEDCEERLIRGGAWYAKAWYVRPAKRDWAPYWLKSARVGIRIARDLE